MTPAEIAEISLRAIADAAEAGLAGPAHVVLVIPRGGTPRGFPRGELLQEKASPAGAVFCVRRYPADRLLAWLVRAGLARYVIEPDGRRRLIVHADPPRVSEA